jgi:hypothetical protein
MASDPAEFTMLLLQFRRRRRRARGRRLAYAAYIALLVAVVYGGPAIVRAARSIDTAHPADLTTLRIEAAAPYGLVALGLLVLTALSRQALWRGPITMSGADAGWLLPLPISRRRLTLPRYIASGIASVIVAALLGLVAATVLHAYSLGSIGELVGVTLAYAVSLALIGHGAAGVIERFAGVAVVIRRARGGLVLITLGFVALASLAAERAADSNPSSISHTYGLWPRVGLGLIAVAIASYGCKVAPAVSAAALRERAVVGTAVSTASYVGDLRRARLAAHSATHIGRQRGPRLRPPRRAAWSIPWRDLDNVMSTPASLGWAAGWTALAGGAFAIAAHQRGDGRHEVFPLAVAMLCGYFAALPYTEPTRLDADDFRRIRWSPYPIRSLATRHATMPAVLATVGQLTGAAVALIWLGGRDEALAISLALATAPVVAVAAMISAFRGSIPVQLLFVGPDLGFGQAGPLLAVLWYLLGPITAVVLGGLASLPVLHAYQSGSPTLAAAVGSILIGAAATALLVLWARTLARRRFAG